MKKYDNYKDSGIEWIGKIPKHWDESKIKYLSKEPNSLFIDGDWIESKVIIEEGIRYITTGNIKVGYYSEQGSGFISEETFAELNCTEVFEGDLVISRLNNPIGRACIIPNLNNRIVTSVDNVIFRPDSNVNKFYLLYLFSSKEYFEITDLISRGATMQRISRGLYGNIKIPLPSIEEQNAIANYLKHKTTQIDTLISKKEQFISLLQEERTAVINQAVTKGLAPKVKLKDSGIEWLGEIPEHWIPKKLKFFCFITKLSGFEYTKEWETNENGDIIALRGYNISNGRVNDIKTERISSELSLKLFRSKLYKNDIVYPCTGTIGNAAIIEENDKYHINQNIARINPNSDLVYPKFLFYNLIADATKKQIDFNNSSSMQPVILIGDLRNITIAFPPYEEQVQLVTIIEKALEQFDIMLNNSEKEIELLKEYKMALISEVVTGKVDVRDVVLN